MLPTPPPPLVVDLKSWVSEWAREFKLTDLKVPLAGEQLSRHLAEFDVRFPEDYIELLRDADGLVINNDHVVFGTSDIYDISLAGGQFVLIAEVNHSCGTQGSIGVKAGAKDGELYFLSHEGGASETLGISFRRAVESVCCLT